MAEGINSHSFQPIQQAKAAANAEELANAKELSSLLRYAKQDAAKDAAQTLMQTRNPLEAKLRKTRKGLKDRQVKKTHKTGSSLKSDKADETASRYEKNNPELKKASLMLLRERLMQGEGKSKEEVLKELKKFYPDPALADEALDFLLESTEAPLKDEIRDAKKQLNDNFSREIKAGRNMGTESRAFSEKGLGNAEGLRDLYRDITHNPRTPVDLFEELNQKFDFEQLKESIKFFFQALGADFRAAGPSIPRGQLHQMMRECKTLQAILGVYYFFKARMRLIENAMKRNGIAVKKTLSFQALAKIYMSLVSDRYPSSDKVLALSRQLGVDSTLVGQIILFTQMRDAIRQTSPNLYRSDNHREELWMALIEALEDLEVELEEEEEEELIYYDAEKEALEEEKIEKEETVIKKRENRQAEDAKELDL